MAYNNLCAATIKNGPFAGNISAGLGTRSVSLSHMRYLLGTDSVHTTASACDYLEGRAGAGDTVVAVHVQSADDDARDGREALNVATVRLGAIADVETEQRTGDPVEELLASAGDHDVDELVIGPRSGEPGADQGMGSVASELLGQSSRPVVVVPLEEL